MSTTLPQYDQRTLRYRAASVARYGKDPKRTPAPMKMLVDLQNLAFAQPRGSKERIAAFAAMKRGISLQAAIVHIKILSGTFVPAGQHAASRPTAEPTVMPEGIGTVRDATADELAPSAAVEPTGATRAPARRIAGHKRWQPYGPGRRQRKLIWIRERVWDDTRNRYVTA
jgi:hypothetical protein